MPCASVVRHATRRGPSAKEIRRQGMRDDVVLCAVPRPGAALVRRDDRETAQRESERVERAAADHARPELVEVPHVKGEVERGPVERAIGGVVMRGRERVQHRIAGHAEQFVESGRSGKPKFSISRETLGSPAMRRRRPPLRTRWARRATARAAGPDADRTGGEGGEVVAARVIAGDDFEPVPPTSRNSSSSACKASSSKR